MDIDSHLETHVDKLLNGAEGDRDPS